MDSKWMNVFCWRRRNISEIISVHPTFSMQYTTDNCGWYVICRLQRSETTVYNFFSFFFSKCGGIPQKHHYHPDVCNVLAYISVLEIWLLVQNLSWEAPLRGKVYFQYAYLYSACLNREAKWSESFPAIRPGKSELPFSQLFSRQTWSQNEYKWQHVAW